MHSEPDATGDTTRRPRWVGTALALARAARPDHLLLVVGVHLSGVGLAAARGWVDRGGPRGAVTGSAAGVAHVATGSAAVVLVSVGIHLANELADRDTDALTTRTRFSGGSGATVDTGLSGSTLARATGAAMALGLFGVGLLAVTEAVTVGLAVVLVVAALLGWQYSLPPLALARRGWGEVDNALLGGALLPLAGVATVAPLTVATVVATVLAVLPATLAVFANLLATQWPDRWADAAVGKWTLATRWTVGRLRLAHATALAGAVVVAWLLPREVVPLPVAWGATASVPAAVWAVATFTDDDQPLPTVAAMVVLLAGTGVAWWLLALGVVAG